MGTIVPRPQKDGTTRYRAQIRIKRGGKIILNESRTFSKMAIAKQWIVRRELELEEPGALEGLAHAGVTVGQMLRKYLTEVSDGFGRSKREHIKQMVAMPLADAPAVGLSASRLIEHVRWRREQGAGPSTVGNDLIWLRVVYRYTKTAWGWPVTLEAIDDAAETARQARLVAKSKKRYRRPTPEELEKLSAYFLRQRHQQKRSPPMYFIMWFAIYSCRRLSEIVSIRREDTHADSWTYLVRNLKHPDGSAGNDKLALMGPMGWEVVAAWLEKLPGDSGLLFDFGDDAVGTAFYRACKILGIKDLRFHDLRHEGASRLAEDGATIPEIQQVTLHESWGSLQIYVNIPARRQRRVDFTKPPASPSPLLLPSCQDTLPAL